MQRTNLVAMAEEAGISGLPIRGRASRIEAWFGIVIEQVAGILVLVEVLILFAGVVARYGFGQAVSWTEEVPRFAGRFAAFDGIRFEPKPRQRPHPPIVIGGHAAPALRRAARFGDGWYGFGLTVEAAAPMVQELRRLRATTGRPPLEISLTTFEPLTPALVAQATQAGVDRLIVMPRVRAEQLEATVRALAQFARAG